MFKKMILEKKGLNKQKKNLIQKQYEEDVLGSHGSHGFWNV